MARILKIIEEAEDPNRIRLVLNEELPVSEPQSFYSREEANSDPYAAPLFDIIGLQAVTYFGKEFILVKSPGTPWKLIVAPACNIINTRVGSVGSSALEEKRVKEKERENAVSFEMMKPEERLFRIKEVLQERITSLQEKGILLEVLQLRYKVLMVRYEGPEEKADQTLKEMTQLLRHKVSPLIAVRRSLP
ncbi:MAG: NifU N-terminal domain-containing protein [Deltaproteobacteria bacterium]|nr:NifU N-terminal domain-containing protein [Deltaproteobacteria bacterium]